MEPAVTDRWICPSRGGSPRRRWSGGPLRWLLLRGRRGLGGLGGGVVDGLPLLAALRPVLGDESFEGGAYDGRLDGAIGVLLGECRGDLRGGAGFAQAREVVTDEVDELGPGRRRGCRLLGGLALGGLARSGLALGALATGA